MKESTIHYSVVLRITESNPRSTIITTYFAKLKTFWNELAMDRPSCSYRKGSCGGVKDLHAHFQTEHVMMFVGKSCHKWSKCVFFFARKNFVVGFYLSMTVICCHKR